MSLNDKSFTSHLYPELDILSKLKLLTSREIRSITDRRKEHENSILSSKGDENRKSTYNSLDFELKFLDDIKTRRTLTGNNTQQFETEFEIVKRVVRMYNVLLVENSTSILQTAASEQYQSKINELIENTVEKYPNNEQVWYLAASWYSERHYYDIGRTFFFRGLNYNSKSELLYKGLFQLELRKAVECKEQDRTGRFTRVRTIFECILNTLADETNTDFVFSLLELLDEYEKVTGELQNDMISLLKQKYTTCEYFWDMLALRELDGLHCNTENLNNSVNSPADKCIARYNEGLNVLATKLMWKLFLNTLMISNKFDDTVRKTYLEKAYKLSQNNNVFFLDEHHILKLVELCETNKQREEILKFTTERIPDSVQLWYTYMSLYISDEKSDNIENIFNKGIVALKDKAIPLWELKIKYYTMRLMANHENLLSTVCDIHMKGIFDSCKEISEKMQTKYLDWLVVQKGLSAARKVYLLLTKGNLNPPMEVHYKMYELEKLHPTPNQDIIKRILGIICKNYGKTEIDCWLDYVDYVKKESQNVDPIYEEALKNLDPAKRPIFDIRFKLLV